MARVVVFTLIVAFALFCAVQDRVTADGARRYVDVQRAALGGEGAPLTIDEVMRPAIRSSVNQGLLWSGAVAAVGLGGAALWSRRFRRE